MTRSRSPRASVPEEDLRITSVLRRRGVRDAVAECAKQGAWSNLPPLNAGSEAVADHLARGAAAPESDAAFFDTRRFSEAIVLLKARPVLLVRNGIFDTAPLADLEARLARHRQALVVPISSVGRIELMDHDTLDWCGTGWRIEEDIIVTNRHVANLFAERRGRRFAFRFNRQGKAVRARIDFREEHLQAQSEEHPLVEVEWIADDLSEAPDIAILRLARGPGLPPPLELAARDALPEQEIAAVGYPARDSRNDGGAMQDIFGDIYDVKRFSPGEVVALPAGAWHLTHDCTTLGGNSGSAVLSIDGGEVVGLHFGGQFRKTNNAVKASVIRSILARKSWVPVRGMLLPTLPEDVQEVKRTVASLRERGGYDSAFLGVRIDLPKPGKSHQVPPASPGARLDYLHFSVVMSPTRRLPILTGVNIDGALKHALKRVDAWGFDPRIPRSAQVGHKDFYGPAAFDKGHMVRREDPGWGQDAEQARQAQEDSFVYTNAVPQVAQLNQRSWLALEDYVLENARTRGFRVSVFTGPVLRVEDPVHHGVQVPLDFWKVVAMVEEGSGELLSSAYVLSQEGMMPTEGFRFGAFRTFQVPLARITALADIRFSRALEDADVFADADLREAIAHGRYVEIEGPDDLILTPVRTSRRGVRRRLR